MVSAIDMYIQKTGAVILPLLMYFSGVTLRASCLVEGRGPFFPLFVLWNDMFKMAIRPKSFLTQEINCGQIIGCFKIYCGHEQTCIINL